MWMQKTPPISLFNNSEKLVQILLEFGQQTVKVTSLCWQSFAEKNFFQKICDKKIRFELFGRILRLCTKYDRQEYRVQNFRSHCCSLALLTLFKPRGEQQ